MMGMEEITKDLLMQTLQTQQRMSEDISEIKATLKEAAQILTHLNRDVSELRSRLEKVEKHPMECQAATRHSAWSVTGKDFMWVLGLLAAIASVWALRK
jgi:regulator of replication initiation timing